MGTRPILGDTNPHFTLVEHGMGLVRPIRLPETFQFNPELTSKPLPAEFDWRKSPYFMHVIRNQGRCGSCWAFATTTVLSNRLSIWTKGKVRVVLSPQDVVSCSLGKPRLNGCEGGSIEDALIWISTNGVVSEQDYPYAQTAPNPSFTCATDPLSGTCPCQAPSGNRYFFREDARSLNTLKQLDPLNINMTHTQIAEAVKLMQTSIYHYGPIPVGIWATQGLQQWTRDQATTSVFYRTPGDTVLGAHAVTIIGWGDQLNGRKVEPYWIVQNSWGEQWGDGGFWYHIRGGPTIQSCSIENTPYTAGVNLRKSAGPDSEEEQRSYAPGFEENSSKVPVNPVTSPTYEEDITLDEKYYGGNVDRSSAPSTPYRYPYNSWSANSWM